MGQYYNININTMIFVTIFIFCYLTYVLLKIRNNKIDIIDAIFLSTIVIFPALFTYFPFIFQIISNVIGVKFPFIILFGLFIFLIFIQIHRIAEKLNQLKMQNIKLIQEFSIIKNQLSKKKDEESN